MQNKFTDIFFDLDHTLWDFDTNSKNAFKKLIQENELPINIDEFCAVYEPINQKYWEQYSKGLKTKEQVKFGRFIDSFKVLKIDVNKEFIEYFSYTYLDFLEKEREIMPGTPEILDYLKPKYNLHILTNGFIEIQEKKLINAEIKNYFQKIISSEEIQKQKPHPDVFKYALEKAKTTAHKSVMIGDNLKNDILGARNVGIYAIHYDPYHLNKINKKIIPKVNQLTELKDYL